MDKMIDELVERIKALSLERQAALFTWLEKAENEELTASDAARVLGVDRQTLIRRIERGELKARKDGRFWRIKRRDIEPKRNHNEKTKR